MFQGFGANLKNIPNYIQAFLRRIEPRTPWSVLSIILILALCLEAGVFVHRQIHEQAVHTVAITNNSSGDTLCIQTGKDCPTPETSSLATLTPSSSPTTAAKTAPPTANAVLKSTPISAPIESPVTPSYPSISTQCTSLLATDDEIYIEASETESEVQTPINSLIAAANALPMNERSFYYQQIANDYVNANNVDNGAYKNYVSGVTSYVPEGGKAGDCVPDLSAPVQWPTSYMGVAGE